MAWIQKIEPDAAEGELRQEYDSAIKRAGRVYQILQVQSLNSRTLNRSIAFYIDSMHGPSGLTRADREFLATVVSRANHCFY